MRRGFSRNILSFFLKKKNFYITIVTAITIFAILFSQILSIVLVLLLITSIVALKILEGFLPSSVNIDLSLFVLVVILKAYNLPLALIVTITGFLIGIAFRENLTPKKMTGENLIFPPIGYIAVGFFISFLQFEIFTSGMIAVVFYAALMTILYGLAYGFPVFDIILFWITIVPFNYWVFKTFGEIVLSSLI